MDRLQYPPHATEKREQWRAMYSNAAALTSPNNEIMGNDK
jgi:hypothetical protein